MCSIATRLCIEQTVLNPGPLKVYYPSALIPIQSINLLFLHVFNGSIPNDCQPTNINRATSFEITEKNIINEFVNSTTIELPILSNQSYYFQLQDLSNSICILGPDLYGSRVPRVSFIAPFKTFPIPTTSPTPTPETNSSWLQQIPPLVIVLAVLSIILVALIGFCVYKLNYRKDLQVESAPGHPPTSTDTIVTVPPEPELTPLARNLIAGSTTSDEYFSVESGSYSSSIRLSKSLESASFKTAQEYIHSDSGSSLDVDMEGLFDDKASTVTVKYAPP